VTGSSLIALVVPIMAFTGMAFWLGLVFYADSHPGYGRKRSSKPSVSLPVPEAGDAVASAEHERIDDGVLAGRAS